MTPEWENVRLGLANSHHPKPRFEAWRRLPFWCHVTVSFAIWFLLAVVIFR